MKNKRGIEAQMVGWVILGLVILVVVATSIYYMYAKGEGALAFLQNMFRSRG